ncbi:hypothetical protein KC871_02415 [Candidatus Saccharibacteria bacterium]|nr:hypothetical protein [Candidatus Saccharibacteria bacterium]MCB9817741.1 hypothetical protein [Candidatus Nomurabacteria bacterium]HPD98831.1 hypothetical protein [Candidatus Saccharibacteria bacterium]
MKKEPSNASGRTLFAWRRTALALVAIAALAMKLAGITQQPIGIITATIALFSALVVAHLSSPKQTPLHSSYARLWLSATSVVLVAISALVCFW